MASQRWLYGPLPDLMLGCGLGCALTHVVVNWLDKKPAIYLSVLGAAASTIMLAVLFVTGWVETDLTYVV